jgi:hypothetical protein
MPAVTNGASDIRRSQYERDLSAAIYVFPV